MAPLGKQLHQPVFAVAGVQPERPPHQQAAGYAPEGDAYPLVRACQVKDDHRKEHRRQSAGESEQVLRLEPLELDGVARTLVYRIFHRSEEEGTQDGGGHNQEDTRKEPARGGLRGVRVTAGELAVGLDAAHKPQHGTDGIAQFGGGIEVRGHEAGRLVDTGKALALRESMDGNHRTQHGKKDSSLHCRIVWVRHKFDFDCEDKWG